MGAFCHPIGKEKTGCAKGSSDQRALYAFVSLVPSYIHSYPVLLSAQPAVMEAHAKYSGQLMAWTTPFQPDSSHDENMSSTILISCLECAFSLLTLVSAVISCWVGKPNQAKNRWSLRGQDWWARIFLQCEILYSENSHINAILKHTCLIFRECIRCGVGRLKLWKA